MNFVSMQKAGKTGSLAFPAKIWKFLSIWRILIGCCRYLISIKLKTSTVESTIYGLCIVIICYHFLIVEVHVEKRYCNEETRIL